MSTRTMVCGIVIFWGIAGLALGCTRARPETVTPVAAAVPTNTLPYCTPVATSQPTWSPGTGPTVVSAQGVLTGTPSTAPTLTPIPAPSVPRPTPTWCPVPVATPPSSSTNEICYIVQPNDTLYAIAARYGTSVDALVALNGLNNADQIRAGQELKIRLGTGGIGAGQYLVKPGDTMFSIAQRLGVSVEALGQANGIGSPWLIQPGQVLVVPGGGSAVGAIQTKSYTVRAGDTLYSIAVRLGTTVEALAAANGLSNPEQIAVGQVLVIPG